MPAMTTEMADLVAAPRRATGAPSTSWCVGPTPRRTPWRADSPATRRTRRRGTGRVPAGLQGPQAVPWGRAVLDLDVPDHRELRGDPSSASGPSTATTNSPEHSSTTAPEHDPRRVPSEALRDELDEALAELSPKLRAVVVLRDVYDLPHEIDRCRTRDLRDGRQGPSPSGPPATQGPPVPAADRGGGTAG